MNRHGMSRWVWVTVMLAALAVWLGQPSPPPASASSVTVIRSVMPPYDPTSPDRRTCAQRFGVRFGPFAQLTPPEVITALRLGGWDERDDRRLPRDTLAVAYTLVLGESARCATALGDLDKDGVPQAAGLLQVNRAHNAALWRSTVRACGAMPVAASTPRKVLVRWAGCSTGFARQLARFDAPSWDQRVGAWHAWRDAKRGGWFTDMHGNALRNVAAYRARQAAGLVR